MFTYEFPSSALFFDAFSGLHDLQQQQYHDQLINRKPKIVKRLETEDFFQIQIFKQNGNFSSYEMKVLKSFGQPNLVNLVVESDVDGFKKVFQFRNSDIEVQDIDWQQYKSENVLVINVPKRVKFCSDDLINTLASRLLGLPISQTVAEPCRGFQNKRKGFENRQNESNRWTEGTENALQKRSAEKQLRMEEEAQKRVQLREHSERQDAERLSFIQEEIERQSKIRKEAERHAQLEREAKKRAKIDAEKKRIAAIKDKERKEAAKHRAMLENEYQERLQAEREYISALFGGILLPQLEHKGSSQDQSERSEEKMRPCNSSPTVELAQKSHESPKVPIVKESPETTPADDEHENSDFDLESISSETRELAPDSRTESLRRHPSLEEVEDEEFVLLRKKFGK